MNFLCHTPSSFQDDWSRVDQIMNLKLTRKLIDNESVLLFNNYSSVHPKHDQVLGKLPDNVEGGNHPLMLVRNHIFSILCVGMLHFPHDLREQTVNWGRNTTNSNTLVTSINSNTAE